MRPAGLGRWVLVGALALGLLVLTPGPSWACSCAMATTAEHVRAAGTVASGTVDWTASDGQTLTYAVDVDRVYKGAAAMSEKLRTSASDASCGLTDLAPGRRYLFFIEGRHPGTMRIGLCGGTTEYAAARAREVESVTGPPASPIAATSEPQTEDTGDRSPVVLGVAGLALLVLAGVAVVRRRRPGLAAKDRG